MIQDMALSAAALISLACGIYLLQAAWRSKGGRAKEICGGWGLILVGLVVFSFKDGPEKGVALGLAGLPIIALVYLIGRYVQTEPKDSKPGAERVVEASSVSFMLIMRRTLVFLMVAVIAGLAALSFSAGVFSLFNALGAEHTGNLVAVMLLFPLVWAGLAVMIGADKLLWRKSLITLGTGLIPLAYMMVGS